MGVRVSSLGFIVVWGWGQRRRALLWTLVAGLFWRLSPDLMQFFGALGVWGFSVSGFRI